MIFWQSLVGRILRNRAPGPVRIVDLGRIDGPLYAIGDVHGCRALLRAALAGIRADAGPDEPTVIVLGDLVDRGPDSAGVLDDMTAAATANPRTMALMGNHERMMLNFLADPPRAWDWLQQGGFETLRSYGLSLPPSQRLNTRRLHQMLAAHIPDHHRAWLEGLAQGYRASIGGKDYLFTHAGMDGTRPIAMQREQALLWGRDVSPAPDGLCVVQGHVIVTHPHLSDGAIRIDTGAFATGVLTVLRLSSGQPPKVMSFGSLNN
ncbi:metallophosphoesterase [Paragemmobacter straminiformis]|uniref:Metallophosphoesterase n=1 Tax=Paragemmobacter straminiformis TaxID=2045119 RepID=A0A842I656_9RHOB|nr:metallophosphoesterase [Gemmobacter straminiformis]MBC2835106.1 metallophosphoesterase [Gemmobacter straminiformis]